MPKILIKKVQHFSFNIFILQVGIFLIGKEGTVTLYTTLRFVLPDIRTSGRSIPWIHAHAYCVFRHFYCPGCFILEKNRTNTQSTLGLGLSLFLVFILFNSS
jgi:hypothetical protein